MLNSVLLLNFIFFGGGWEEGGAKSINCVRSEITKKEVVLEKIAASKIPFTRQ